MDKHRTRDGYDDGITGECIRVLVTLLRGLGPWKESVYPVGADRTRSHLLDGPVSVAKFELGEENDTDTVERRVLRQREVSSTIASLLDGLG